MPEEAACMNIHLRWSFSGENNLRAMEALAREFRADNLHITDLPYRLSSWVLDDPENVRLLIYETGCMLAWAILQIPHAALDFVYSPEMESDLLPQLMDWADEHSREHYKLIPLGTPDDQPCWFVNVFSDKAARIRILEASGFAYQANVGEYSWPKGFMQRSVDLPLIEYRIPEGFIVRPLSGESGVALSVKLYQETFGTKNMTVDWWRRTLQHPDYVPALDLVVAAPDRRLAVFCVCWLDRQDPEPIGQIEPLGCQADVRINALGRVTLAEGLCRLHTNGGKKAFVETDNWRNTAFRLYESVGFDVLRDVLVDRKDYQQA
jgi:mycothiol synthase